MTCMIPLLIIIGFDGSIIGKLYPNRYKMPDHHVEAAAVVCRKRYPRTPCPGVIWIKPDDSMDIRCVPSQL